MTLLLAVAGSARADSLSLRYVPQYNYAAATAAGADVAEGRSESQKFEQDFHLSFDRRVLPTLTWSGSGVLEWSKSWNHDAAGTWIVPDQRKWTAGTRLELVTDTLRAGAGYTRNETDAEIRRSGVTDRADGPVSDNYSLDLRWSPGDLPRATLSLSRRNVYDFRRRQMDVATNGAALALDYTGLEKWQFRYAYLLANPNDRLRESETLSQTHSARVSWADRFFGGRLSTFASYQAALMTTRTTSGASGGTRETQRLPSAGLSRIEAFPDVTGRVTLQPNPALVDSDVSTGAGIDLGWGRSVAGDVAPRDVGAQFPDPRSDLNEIYVWVDRPLPDLVVGAFIWEAWVSDDNLAWTRVPLAGVPAFGVLRNRFEIRIERTRARYVKVVTRPLAAAITTDPRYAGILVTEVQFALIEDLAPGTVRLSELSGALGGGARYLLLRTPNLAYDVAFTLWHAEGRYPDRGQIQHSLTFIRALDAASQVSATASRLDSFDQGRRHTGQDAWGAAITSQPLPTLGWNANYSGAHTSSPESDGLSNGVSAGARADLYEGVSSSATGSYRIGEASGRRTQSAQVTAGLTVTPHRALTATGSFGWSYGESRGGGMSATRERSGRVEGSITLNPVPSLYLAASGGRNLFGMPPATQTNVSAGFSLFPRGALSFRLNYGETRDGQTDNRGRTYGAGLTWNIFRGRSLTAVYSHLRARSPLARSDIDSVNAVLQWPVF